MTIRYTTLVPNKQEPCDCKHDFIVLEEPKIEILDGNITGLNLYTCVYCQDTLSQKEDEYYRPTGLVVDYHGTFKPVYERTHVEGMLEHILNGGSLN